MVVTPYTLGIQRLKPGAFGGIFDQVLHEHPAFALWVVVTLILVTVVLFTAWLLSRHARRLQSRPERRFEVLAGPDRM